ncbi:MAG: hypothetical protein ACOYMS_08085 [Terrimicrobiaceae bacterium]
MWFPIRLLVVVLLPLTVLTAQEQASPTPTPEAGASPAPSPAGEPTATPAASPAPEASATPATDVIPLEGQPQPPDAVTGAPLETRDLAPVVPRTDEAMPDEAFTDPNAIIPDAPLPPSVPAVAESAEEKARQLSIRYREVRVKVEKDPKLQNLLQQADAAKTEEDRRAAFRTYYRLLFSKIAAADKSLADRCKIMEDAYIRRLAQERLEPTIPLNPPPTPEPIGN